MSILHDTTGKPVPILCKHTNCKKFEYCRLKFMFESKNCSEGDKIHENIQEVNRTESKKA